ncbi:MAG TPA: cell division protein FtsQ/DivIB [Candidatus Binataceae bacterium]|jgi:hypothetical protein
MVVVAVAAAKRKKNKTSASHWGFRLAGIVLCAFFVLGVMTGLSRPGRTFALRLESILKVWPGPGHSSIIPAAFTGGTIIKPALVIPAQGASVALVQRGDNFYTLDSDGSLRGPVTPAAEGDMPILNGPGALDAAPAQLIDDAAALVRAEAALGSVVSEMRIDSDGSATIFLEHPRIEITFDVDHAAIEFARALEVLKMWRGHENLIAALDLTTPGQAVMQMTPAAFAGDHRTPAVHPVALSMPARLPRIRHEESTHR